MSTKNTKVIIEQSDLNLVNKFLNALEDDLPLINTEYNSLHTLIHKLENIDPFDLELELIVNNYTRMKNEIRSLKNNLKGAESKIDYLESNERFSLNKR